MSIELDNVELDELDSQKISRMLENNLIQPDRTTSSERERVQRERKIAAASLYHPPASLQLPNLLMLHANPQISRLGQKITNLSGVEGTDRVSQAAAEAFPTNDIAGSIYEIASKGVQIPVSSAIAGVQANLERMRERGTTNALLASEPEEILASAEDMAFVADLPNEELIEDAIVLAASPFPNLAREIMTLGLGMEGFQTAKLAGYKKQGDVFKQKINHLIEISSLLPKFNSDETSKEVKEETAEKIRGIHDKLNALGLDVFGGKEVTSNFSKEDVAAYNSTINHHIDTNRTSLQELFTTKISIAIQFLSMIGEVMKKISEKDEQLKRKANQIQR